MDTQTVQNPSPAPRALPNATSLTRASEMRTRNLDVAAALLSDGFDIRIKLTGPSMRPMIRTGTVVRFSSERAPHVGDIVLLQYSDNTLVAHRTVAIDDETVWTKGDSSKSEDPPLPRTRVLACATALETRFRVPVPLQNRTMRTLGLAVNRLYPGMVVAYRSLFPRKDAPRCAS